MPRIIVTTDPSHLSRPTSGRCCSKSTCTRCISAAATPRRSSSSGSHGLSATPSTPRTQIWHKQRTESTQIAHPRHTCGPSVPPVCTARPTSSRSASAPRREHAAGTRREDPRRALGRLGEELAAAHLDRLGFATLARNVRTSARRDRPDRLRRNGAGVRRGQDAPRAISRARARSRGAAAGVAACPPTRARAAPGARMAQRLAPGASDRADDPLRRDRGDRRSPRATAAPRPRRGRVVAPRRLQRELLVGERLEGHPVQRRDALTQDRLAVRRASSSRRARQSSTPGAARRRGA